MTEEGGSVGGKVNGIRHIVRLREILQRWQSIALGSSSENPRPENSGGIPPAVSKRLMGTCIAPYDSDDESCQSPEPPPDVPEGYLAVYVGPELRRFIIPTRYLTLPVFKVLLEKAEEEFGFDNKGGLTIPCEIETFKYILQFLERKGDKDLPNDEGTSQV